MKGIVPACWAIFLLLSGCSSEMVKRSAYESMQNKAQMDCQQHPGSTCPEKKRYNEYQRSLHIRSEPEK
jgi:uncharacterized protein YceK